MHHLETASESPTTTFAGTTVRNMPPQPLLLRYTPSRDATKCSSSAVTNYTHRELYRCRQSSRYSHFTRSHLLVSASIIERIDLPKTFANMKPAMLESRRRRSRDANADSVVAIVIRQNWSRKEASMKRIKPLMIDSKA